MSSGPPPVIQTLLFDIESAVASAKKWLEFIDDLGQKAGAKLEAIIGSGASGGSAFGKLKSDASDVGSAIGQANAKLEEFNNTPGPEKVINALKTVEETLRSTLPAGATVAAQAIESLTNVLNADSSSIESVKTAVTDLQRLFVSLGLTILDNKAQIANFEAQIGQIVQGNGGQNPKQGSPLAEEIEKNRSAISALKTENENLRNVQSLVQQSLKATGNEVKVLTRAEKEEAKAEKEAVDAAKAYAQAQKEVAAQTAAHEKAAAQVEATLRRVADSQRNLNQKIEDQGGAGRKATPDTNKYHDVLLGILGTSRLLPGELGRVASGVGLLAGAFRSEEGAITSVIGAAVSLLVSLAGIGFEFNKLLNQQRASAEGFGLTTEQFVALDLIMKETGRSADNLRIGAKKIEGALANVTSEGKNARVSLEAFLGRRLTNEDTVNSLLIEIGRNLKGVADNGTSTTEVVDIFGKSTVNVIGALRDLGSRLEETEKKIHDQGIANKDVEKSARDQAQAITDLEIAWKRLASTLAVPVTGVIKIVNAGISLIDSDKPVNDLEGEIQDVAKLAVEKFKKDNPEVKLPTTEDLLQQLGKDLVFENDALTRLLETLRKRGINRTAINNAFVEQAIEDRKAAEKAQQAHEQEKSTVEVLANKTAAEIEKGKRTQAIAEKQQQLADAEKEVSDTEKALSKFRAENKSQQLIVEEKQKNLDAIIKRDRIQDEIAALRKKEGSGRTKEQKDEALEFSIDIEHLRADLAKLDPLSKEFETTAIEIRKKLIDRINSLEAGFKGKTDPGALRELFSRTKEFRRQLDDVNKLLEGARKTRFDTQFEEVSARASNTIIQEQENSKKALEDATKFFESGFDNIQLLLERELNAASGLNAIIQQFISEKIFLLKLRQDAITDSLDAGNLSPNDATKALKDLQVKIDALNADSQKAQRDTDDKKRQSEDKAANIIIQNRQRLAQLEIDIQDDVNKRRLELLSRASAGSLEIKKAEIAEIDNLERAQIDREIEKNILLLTNLKQAATGSVGLLLNKDITGLLSESSGASLEKLIKDLKGLGSETSPQIITILEATLRAKQKKDNLDQKTAISNQDNEIDRLQQILDLNSQELDFKSKILDLEEKQVNLLKSSGAITELDANEKLLDVDKQRLALLQQRLQAVEKEAALQLNRQIAVAVAGKQDTSPQAIRGFLDAPAFQKLRADFNDLQSQSNELALSIQLSSSTLGRFSKGLGELSGVFAKLPEPLNHVKDIIDGIRKVVDLANGIQAQTPGEKLVSAADTASKTTISSAQQFSNIIVEAARLAATEIKGGSVELPKGKNVLELFGITDLTKDVKPNPSEKGKIISKVFDGVSNLVAGIFSSTAGGKVSGIGSGIGSFLSLIPSLANTAPFIGPIAGALGGVIDTFGSIIRKRTEKIANDLQTEFQGIVKEFKNGSTSLGETVNKLQSELISARVKLTSNSKTSKKGGRESFTKLEADINNELEELRAQAKGIQDKFFADLAKLRQDPATRSTQSTVDEVVSRAKEFIRSFENAADAANHLAEVHEFAARTLQEERDTASKSLKESLNRDLDAERAFQASLLAIENEGRVVSPIQQAQDRIQRIFELEKKRADERAKALEEQTGFEKIISLLDSSVGKVNKSIDSFAKSIDNAANVLNRAFGNGFNFGGDSVNGIRNNNQLISALSRANQTTNSSSNFIVNFNGSITASNPQELVRDIGREVESRMRRLGKISPAANRINPDRPFSS